MKRGVRVEKTGGWWQGWVLGLHHVKCLQEGSAVPFVLCVSQIRALGCSAIQANPPDLLLLTAEWSEHF